MSHSSHTVMVSVCEMIESLALKEIMHLNYATTNKFSSILN